MIRIDIDSTGLTRKLNALSAKALSFAAVNAVNDATKQLQIELKHDVRSRFTIRNEFVVRQAAVIGTFASVRQNRPYAEIGVAIGKTKPARLFLTQFEEGGPRADVAGSPNAAVPVPGGPARPSFRQKVPASYRYKALALRKQGKQRKGRLRTFTLPGIGVFQRTGTGPRDMKAVYLFESNQKLDDRMRFHAIARQFGPRFLRAELERQVNIAIARANRA